MNMALRDGMEDAWLAGPPADYIYGLEGAGLEAMDASSDCADARAHTHAMENKIKTCTNEKYI